MTAQVNGSESLGRRIARFLLFGNYFLALCIVVLSYETTLKNNVSVTGIFYYFIVFFLVVVYYTHAYRQASGASTGIDPRSRWYQKNRKIISATQTVYSILIISLSFILLKKYASSFATLTFSGWLLLFIFPVPALLYYGIVFPAARRRVQLRTIAWLKPFIIGFVCTGCIVIYPMIFSALQQQADFHITTTVASYFLTNWLFTTAIAIMFDIKDFAADHNYHLKTFVVAKGLRYTIFFILLPLSVLSILSFLVFAILKDFSVTRIIINLVPFILLLLAASSLRRRRSILYYLLIIDGLLLVKALFGIAAMTLIN